MRAILLLLASLLLSGCFVFQREPPLPRHAVVEAGGNEAEFVRLIEDADIIYFPTEAANLARRSSPAWKLLAALRGGSSAFAVGHDWTRKDSDHADYLNEASTGGGQILAFNENPRENREGSTPDQIAADIIANYFREHRHDKLLVFVRRERLALADGLPGLVAQRTKARQLILNPRQPASGARLLAGN